MVLRLRSLLVAFLLLSGLNSTAASDTLTVNLTADTLYWYPYYLPDKWLYAPGDDTLRAATNFDDSRWTRKNPRLNMPDSSLKDFPGIGWFRIYLRVDTNLVNEPLGLSLSHYGASDIFVDGKRIETFGVFGGPDSTQYFDPQQRPVIFVLRDTGRHVLAIRYANYQAERMYRVYRNNSAGFQAILGVADDIVGHQELKITVFSSIMMLLNGIFLTLSFLHLFMFLFYRRDKSNLYFSLFMFCLAMGTMISFVCSMVPYPQTELYFFYLINPAFCLACLSLSGFVNVLFSRRKLRFRIIALLCLVSMTFRFFNVSYFGILTICLVAAVSLEAVILIVWAVIRRVRGARIIGTGVLIFALFILTIFALSIALRGLEINDSTEGGRILLVFMSMAILSIPLSMSIYQAWSFARTNKDLGLQLEQVQALSEKTIRQEKEKQQMLENRKEELEREVALRTQELRAEKKKSDDLLLNILPSETAEELKETGAAQAKSFPAVTVMFTDFKDFTQATEKLSAEELVKEINACYSAFDQIISRHNIEKIKTMGDAYMCAGGLPVNNDTHPTDVVRAAIEMQVFIREHMAERKERGVPFFEIRFGIHTGPVVAGIVGIKKFAYDIWGDTVNTASRMQSSGEAGRINISGTTHALVKDKFHCTYRGKIAAKNKGEIDMYFVEEMKDTN